MTHGSLRIGLTHGHTIIPPGDADSLLIAARQMDVDILLWGGSHKFEAYELEGRFFINPGSATGALTTGTWREGEDPTPSFCLMDVSSQRLYPHWLGPMHSNTFDRSKEMCLCFTSINYEQTRRVRRLLLWRRSRSESMALLLHEIFSFTAIVHTYPKSVELFKFYFSFRRSIIYSKSCPPPLFPSPSPLNLSHFLKRLSRS